MQRVSRRSGWWVIVAVVAWSALVAVVAQAQEDSNAGPERSPVLLLGASRSTFGVGGDDAADPKPFWAPRIGLSYTAPRHAVMAFEFGLWADNRGGEWKDQGRSLAASATAAADSTFAHRLRLLYLGVPLMLRVSVPSAGLMPYVKGGVVPAFLLNAREQARRASDGVLVSRFHGVRDRCRAFQLDALIGAGVRTDIARHAFIVETIYMYGLTDVLKESAIKPRNDLTNRSLQFFVGIGLQRERATN